MLFPKSAGKYAWLPLQFLPILLLLSGCSQPRAAPTASPKLVQRILTGQQLKKRAEIYQQILLQKERETDDKAAPNEDAKAWVGEPASKYEEFLNLADAYVVTDDKQTYHFVFSSSRSPGEQSSGEGDEYLIIFVERCVIQDVRCGVLVL